MPDPIYAIGDIHGQITMLEDVLARIDADGGSNARIVFLGDYVDRGPDSRGVLECLAKGRSQGYKWILLKGNHDRMFQWFMEDPPKHDPYLFAGYHWFHKVIGGQQINEILWNHGEQIPSTINDTRSCSRRRPTISPEPHPITGSQF